MVRGMTDALAHAIRLQQTTVLAYCVAILDVHTSKQPV